MKFEARIERAESPEPGVEHSSGKSSDSVNAEESAALASSTKGGCKATGPRTAQGKQRSSRNSLKHGIYSQVIILKSESKAAYRNLLSGLQKALQPEGKLEELLVEKLAVIAWRQRRLLSAEGAEIRKNTEFFETDRLEKRQQAADSSVKALGLVKDDGILQHAHNPHLFDFCLEQVVGLREKIEKDGLCPEHDKPILAMIYGVRNTFRLREDFYDSYETWLHLSKISEQDEKAWPTSTECKLIALEKMDKEILRLKRMRKARASVEAARAQLEVLSRGVPDGPQLDRLLRYEASLERAFDRTLSQLERLQRMRLGQPVLPKLEVRHSLS